MSRTRWLIPVLAVVLAVTPASARFPNKKPKSDARVRQMIDVLKSDPDEKKRRSAVGELRDADPRLQPDVVPALVKALQADPSAGVRADAAEALGSFKVVFPLAGLALEATAEADPSVPVRDAAQQALWEYHLAGYRSTKGADGIAGQTAEPPIAKKPAPRPAPVAVASGVTPSIPVPPQPTVTPGLPTVTTVPPAAVRPLPTAEPRLAPVGPPQTGVKVTVSSAPPSELNVTPEPPIAKKPGM